MWIADQWKDYEVIDCSKGEKLERWGKYALVARILRSSGILRRRNNGWKHMNGHYHRSKKGMRMGILQPPGTVADSL